MMVQVEQLLAQPELARLAHTLIDWPGAHADAPAESRRAAVALVLRTDDDGGLDLLFIQRAEYAGDPWSGQVAFPGGRQEAFDDTLRETAVRETREELGLDLERDGVILGTLDELHPRTPVLPPIVVRPYVAVVRAGVALTLSEEVANMFWVPLRHLRNPASIVDSTVHVRGRPMTVSSVRHEEYVIWGMTERMLRGLLLRMEGATG